MHPGTSHASGRNRETRLAAFGRWDGSTDEQTQLRNAGILLGLSLGGFFDGIVLTMLQWHTW